MAFLNYEYRMTIRYTEPVDKCYFTIKAIPAEDFRQRNISYDITLVPQAHFSQSMDSFGNSQIIGCENMPHSEFVFQIKGLVETNPINLSEGINPSLVGMYKYPYGKCIPGDAIKAFYQEIKEQILSAKTDKERCVKLMNCLYERMVYEPGSTCMETSAEEAFASKKGVCQDYSHIYITLLRMMNIPARYVCGLIVGEGESHAWVEVVLDGNYFAFDPTHNTEITDEYIKLGVGRDAKDCAINRGVMWGGGTQTQEVKVSVEKYY